MSDAQGPPQEPAQDQPLRVAVVGSGPAGVNTAAALLRSAPGGARVDVLERLPAPFGLVRYGVSPDHPDIKAIATTLSGVLEQPGVRLVANVEVGRDVELAALLHAYDAVVLATGSSTDAPTDLPGADLPGSRGASEVVAWYEGHPDAPRTWDLSAREVAVVGVGNVALDVARVLARPAEDLLATEVPAAVAEQLAASALREVHVLGRRGPEHARFSPLELRELASVTGVDVLVDPAELELDDAAAALVAGDRRRTQVLEELVAISRREPAGAPRRVHLRFGHEPVAVLGEARVEGLRTRTTRGPDAGALRDWPVQAVYRATGYRSTPVPGAPFDAASGTVPHEGGRVLGPDGLPVPGLYAAGWVATGPVGLVGHTRSGARRTVAALLEDAAAAPRDPASAPEVADLVEHLAAAGAVVVDHPGWLRIDAAELAAGTASGRPRVKIVDREELLDAAREVQAGEQERRDGGPGGA